MSLTELIDIFLHLDHHINHVAGLMGPWFYLLLFAIVFCETGLVVTPFLPGDSLLFAVGALAGSPESPLDVTLLAVLLIAAAILGDAVNYWLGYQIGPRVFRSESSWLLNKHHLIKAQRFYERYGSKTIVLARFVPIIRTFAPFVAGIGKMQYRRFFIYNVVGGVAWVLIFLLGGYFLAGIPAVENNFHYIIVAIIFISVLPMLVEYLLARRRTPQTEPVGVK
jgi:membrane-associated protein